MKQSNNMHFIFFILLAASLIGCNTKLDFETLPVSKVEEPSVDPEPTPEPEPPTPPAPPVQKITETTNVTIQQRSVDVLFVTDNSSSMDEDQEKLSERFQSFIHDLSDVDWQIGITTTDVGYWGLDGELSEFDGTSQKIINKNTPNAEALFKSTIQREENGSNTEEPLAALISSMNKRNNENRGFFRDHADLAVVILSDEDEHSDGDADGTTQAQDVINKFKSIWGETKQMRVYGIIIEPGDEACLNQHGNWLGHYGDVISSLVTATNGFTGSICDSDYSSTLRSIGNNITEMFNDYTLSKTPKAGSLEVKMTPNHGITWTLNGKTISFHSPVPDGTAIEFVYEEQ